ncbi:MAG: hypothetical protein ACK57C_09910 [Bacteroidota bacterium]
MRRSRFYLLSLLACTISCARLHSPAEMPDYQASTDRMTGTAFFSRANV